MTEKRKFRKSEAGFTLVEVLVTLAIIAIMATVVVVTLLPETGKADMQKARIDINNLEQAIQLYYLDMKSFPEGLEALTGGANAPSDPRYRPGGYIKFLPSDPWNNPYEYAYPGNNGVVDIWSYGADGEPGGEGINADITNWAQ